jgi:predicted glycoside hydrolase/deacetylase ChbG (UPF0249 family)
MAVGAAFEDAISRARAFPRLGIGVHLTWVEERPVSSPKQIPSLVDEEGRLPRVLPFLLRLQTGRIREDELERETRAQLERVIAAGLRPTYVDSHKHLHLYPPLLRLVLRLLPEYGIRTVRLPHERFPWRLSKHLWRRLPRALPIRLLAGRARRKLREAGIFFPDHFFGLFHTGALTEAVLLALLRRLPDGVSELLCHPGIVDESLAAVRTRLRFCREVEWRALMSPALREEIHRRGIHLVTYDEALFRWAVRSRA